MTDTALATFATPPPEARAWLRWWWPGGAVDRDALCQQLRGFAEAGWGGVEIQPVRIGLGEDGALPAVDDVFTPAWFETVRAVMDEAERLGLGVDVTFGSCWPLGGGEAVTPELAQTELTLAWTTVHGPGPWQGRPAQPQRPARFGTRLERDGEVPATQQLPEAWRERLAARHRIEAVLAVRGGVPEQGPFAGFVPLTLPDDWAVVHAPGWIEAARTIDLTHRLQPDGTLAWKVPAGEWQIVVVARFASDQRLTAATGHGPQLVIDHLKREAFDAHAARVGDAALAHWGPHAGKTWRGIFVDSLELPLDLPWTDDVAEEFERRRGYALRPHLPLLLQPGWRNCFQARRGAPLFDDAQIGARVRADYRRTVSELMVERHCAAIADWAQRHGLQARVQAHGAPADWLAAYGAATVPETEDLAGGAAPHFLRVARSAAHQHGRPLVSAEAFCWLLEGWAVNWQQLRERADTFFAAGIQQLVGHGASAEVARPDGTRRSWYPFADMEIGTQLDAGNPQWRAMRPLTDRLARQQALLRRGHAVVPVAVLMPPEFFAFDGAADRLVPPAWHVSLQQAGLDWDWINGEALQRCPVAEGALVTPSGQRYAAIVLPALDALSAEVAGRLAALAAAGVTVWSLDAPPLRDDGLHDAEARDARVRAAMAAAVPRHRRLHDPAHLGPALRSAGLPGLAALVGGSLPPGVQTHERLEADGTRWLLIHHPGDGSHTLALAEGPHELWDAWTGAVHRVGASTLALPPRSALWLRTGAPTPGALARPARRTAASGPVAALSGPWALAVEGEGLHGRAVRSTHTLPALADLAAFAELADVAGCFTYTLTVTLDAATAAAVVALDLGRVHDVAAAWIDDQALGVRSEGPFVFDLAGPLGAGLHTVRVQVANRPENARRDPARPGGIPLPGRRLTRLPTGLIGPVSLVGAPPAPESRP